MNKLRLAAVAAITGAIAMFSSVPAQATYVDVTVILTADSPVVGGKTVNFSVTTSSGTVNCDWTVTFSDGVAASENDTRTGSGTSFSGSYESKVVASSTPTTMTARCDYDDGQPAKKVSSSASTGNTVSPAVFTAGLQAAPQNASDSATVILLPEGGVAGEDDGDLPDTGGSNLSWLLIGGALVLAGGGITYATRRRHSAR